MAPTAASRVARRSPRFDPRPITTSATGSFPVIGSRLYAANGSTYMWRMLGLTPSEIGIVIFIFLLVVAAGRLPAWGEAAGGYLHRRKAPNRQDPPTDADAPKPG